MRKINIIQFTPYFPPHKGGLETVGEEIGKYWVNNDLGNFINVTTHFNQETVLIDSSVEKIVYDDEVIGYKKSNNGDFSNIVLVVPSREIIFNFPIYDFHSKKYKLITKYLKEKIQNKHNDYEVITHTRFFLQSFYGGLFARKNSLKWNHIEHGSGYAKLSSKFKTFIGIIYDNLVGMWIFKKSDKILPISKACEQFVLKVGGKNIKDKISVFYRGLDLGNIDIEKSGEIKLVFVGRLVSLKGVSDLLEAYKRSKINNELIIIGDGDERKKLEKQSKGENINFLGFQQSDYVVNYLSQNNCIFINPSYQEGLPTTVIEGLATGNVVIATDVGGTKEISDYDDLKIINSGDIESLKNCIIDSINSYDELKGKSLNHVNQKFNWDNNIVRLYELLK